MRHRTSRSGKTSAKLLLALFCLEMLVFLVCGRWVSADLTDTRTAWSNLDFAPMTHYGASIYDYEGSSDPTNGGAAVQPAAIDIASGSPDPAQPGSEASAFMAYYDGGTPWDPDDPATINDDFLGFRMRVDADPTKGTGFVQYHWNTIIDVDTDGYKEFWVDLNGPVSAGGDDELHVLYNNGVTQEMPDRAANPEVIIEKYVARNDEDAPGLSHTRAFAVGDGSGDWYIDIQVPMTAFKDINGNQVIFPDQAITPYFSTGASNQDPLQKDWFKPLQPGTYDPDNAIAADDPMPPNGTPMIYFTDEDVLQVVDDYWTGDPVGDNVYVAVRHDDANTDPNVNETVTVTVRNPETGDLETLTLREMSPDGGLFTNQGGATRPQTTVGTDGWIPSVRTDGNGAAVDETWTVTMVGSVYTVTGSVSGVQSNPLTPGAEWTSDNGEVIFTLYEQTKKPTDYTITFNTYAADPLTCSEPTGSGDDSDLQGFDAEKMWATYTYDDVDYQDDANIHGAGSPLIEFIRGNGISAEWYQLNLVSTDSEDIYVRVTDASANTNPSVAETITVALSGNDTEGTVTLTETGPDTGIFRQALGSGLASQASGTSTSNNGIWQDTDGAVVTATYDNGTHVVTDTANIVVEGGGRVTFSNGAGTRDVMSYFEDDPVWIKVPDPNQTASSFDVTVTSETGDSETITLYEIGNTQVFMNVQTDLQTTASSGVVTSPSSTFQTDGLQAGDPFVIATGPDAGTYTIQSVDSETQITLTTALTTTRDSTSPVRFSADPLFADTYEGSYTANNNILTSQDEDLLTVSYADPDDGDGDTSNNTKLDYAYYYDEPTAIMLASFRAAEADGLVVVEWETAAECGTVGFYLLRKDGTTKGYQPVNTEMVPALVSSPQGAIYRLPDDGASAEGNLTYKLVEVESSGKRRTYGPFHIKTDGQTTSLPSAAHARSPSKSGHARYERTARKSSTAAARQERARTKAKTATQGKPQRTLSGGDAARIAVTETGLHYLAAEDIAAAFGCSPEEAVLLIHRNHFRLSYRGKTIPGWPAEEDRGIHFFGEKIDSRYTNENIYWIEVGGGKKMGTIRGKGPAPAAPGATFEDAVHLERDVFPATGFFTDPEADFWVWDYVFGGFAYMDTKAYTMPVHGVADVAEKATLTVRLQGGSDAPVNPDHHVIVSLNDTPIGEARWDGTQPCIVELQFAQNLLVEGDNKITVKGLLDTGAPYSLFYVDSFDLTYQRLYQAANDTLLCRSGENRVLSIGGFSTPEIVVLEIKDSSIVKRIDALTVDQIGETYRVSFRSVPKDVTYLALAQNVVKRPASIVADTPSILKRHKNRAELVIIAPEEFKAAAETLAAYRQGQGMSAMVVDVQDIYDEFNDGVVDPHAIKEFLAWAHRKWRVGPRYVLLAGEGTFDYKNVQGFGDCRVPPLLVGTPFGVFVSDTVYADISGEDGVPELAVGRLPAATVAELTAMIGKIMAYESAAGTWRNRVMMLADYDDTDAGAFRADSDTLARMVRAPYTVDKIYLDDQSSPAAARSAVRNGIESGCYLVNYVGHSFVDQLAKAGLLSASDVKNMSNGDRLPIVTALTCLAGRHGLPGYDALGETLVLKDGGGAVAFWGPASLCFNADSKALGRGFFKAVFQDGQPVLGDAVVAAMTDFAATQPLPETARTYNLLGDPTLRIKGTAGGGSAPRVAKSAKPSSEDGAKGRSATTLPENEPTEDGDVGSAPSAPTTGRTASQASATSGGGSVLTQPEQTVAPGVVLVEKTGSAMVLEIRTPSPVTAGDRLAIEGYGSTDSPGDPLLPMRGVALPIPEGTTVTATVLETETETIDNVDVAPAPRWALQDTSNGKSRLAEGGEWALVPTPVPPSAAYSRDADWPAQIVRAEGAGRMGSIDLAILTVTPVTYNPVTKRATFHKLIRVRLDLRPDAGDASAGIDTTGWQPPGSRAAKLRTSKAGIHRLSLTSLQRAALGVGSLDQLAVLHRGAPVPVCLRSDGIDFLAAENPEPWARESVYWIAPSGGPSPRMAEIDATPQKDAPSAVVAPRAAVLDDIRQIVFVHDNLPLEDRFILAEIAPGARGEFGLALCGPDRAAGAEIRIVAVGGADPATVSVSLNGAEIGQGLTVRVPPGKVLDGENTITIANNGAGALLVKRIEVGTLPDLRAAKGGMQIAVAEGGTLTLAGLPDGEADIYDVTADAPARVTGVELAQDGNTWTARFAVMPRHVYEIVDARSAGSGNVEMDRPSDLRAGRHGADYVVIAPKAFEPSAKRLALHRASQGLRVEVVDIEDIFDEFAFGEADPRAVRRFLAHAYRNWAPPVRQVVLMGDGAIGTGDPNSIPTHVELVGGMATVSDSWFACVDGADSLADIQIGRLPVRTATEAQTVVYKLVRYDFASPEESWAQQMFHVGGEIGVKSRTVASSPVTSSAEMDEALRSGGLLLTLLGPGRVDSGGGGLLQAGSAALTKSRWEGTALVISAESLHGYYASPTVRSLAEDLLCGRGGAIGAIVNTGLLTGEDARLATDDIVQAALAPDASAVRGLGSLLDVGRLALAGQGEFEAVLRTSLLLGDPATVLKTPPAAEEKPLVAGQAEPPAPEPKGDDRRSKYSLIWEVLSPDSGAAKTPASDANQMDMALKATMVGGRTPYAVVQLGSGRQKLIKVGDRIGNAKVVAIEAGSVLLDVDSKQVRIGIRPR